MEHAVQPLQGREAFTRFVGAESELGYQICSPSVSLLGSLPELSNVVTWEHWSILLGLMHEDRFFLSRALNGRHRDNVVAQLDFPFIPSTPIKQYLLGIEFHLLKHFQQKL